jgi:asparagine synthase (glutamine-hydrolysing)
MHFHLKINTASIHLFNPHLKVLDKPGDNWGGNQIFISEKNNHTCIHIIETGTKKAWLIGDPVIEPGKNKAVAKFLENGEYHLLLKNIQGHYRLIIIDKTDHSVITASSLFGILPVYYYKVPGAVYISSDADSLSQQMGHAELNKRFILENILFYYQLFNQTVYKEINLLPAHHLLQVNANGMCCTKYFTVSDWFNRSPVPWKKSISGIAALFIDRVKQYFPEEKVMLALTGGFDSRTLVSCGLYHKKEFETYSFGNAVADDTQIASAAAARAGLKFNNILLDDGYITTQSLKEGLEFIQNSNGNGGFARAHYLYACKAVQSKTKYLITGNFGSEIFRAVHNAGAVISNNLYHLFTSPGFDKAVEAIESSPEFKWLNRSGIEKEWEELKTELAQLPVFNPQYAHLTLNEKFYLFVFEEVFRKYFGAEMVNQFKYLNNRTPFLDSIFLEALFKTGLPGVYSDFLENNPVKRYKGQVLYAHIIRKAFPAFLNIPTGKGYRPKDLLTFTGKLNILVNYFTKKLNRQGESTDPNAVEDAFAINKSWFRLMDINKEIFNEKEIKEALQPGKAEHDFLIALSQAWYVNHIISGEKLFTRQPLLTVDRVSQIN